VVKTALTSSSRAAGSAAIHGLGRRGGRSARSVALIGGGAAVIRRTAGGLGERPTLTWQLPWLVEWLLLLVVFVIVQFLVAGCSQWRPGWRGQRLRGVRCSCSLLAHWGGGFAALTASGLLAWVAGCLGAPPGVQRDRAAPRRPSCSADQRGTEYWMTVAANIGVYAHRIGLNIVVGLAGLLGPRLRRVYGLGAFTAANLSGAAASIVGIHVRFPLVMVICALVAGVFGAIVGSPTLRVRGDYLAIVTLAFGEIFTRTGRTTSVASPARERDPEHPAGVPFRKGVQRVSPDRVRSSCRQGSSLRDDRACSSRPHAGLSRTSESRGFGGRGSRFREDEDAGGAMGIRTGPIRFLAFLPAAMLAGLVGPSSRRQDSVGRLRQLPAFTERSRCGRRLSSAAWAPIPGAGSGRRSCSFFRKLREFSDYGCCCSASGSSSSCGCVLKGLIADRTGRPSWQARRGRAPIIEEEEPEMKGGER